MLPLPAARMSIPRAIPARYPVGSEPIRYETETVRL